MITILELAAELQTSKSTINRKIRDLGLKGALEFSDGKYYLTQEQADKIRQDFTRHKPHQEDQKEGDNKASHEAKRGASRTTAQDKQLIADLMAQLKEKDAQIKKLHGIIEQNQTIIDQQQKLNLISQQRILALEDQQQKQKTEQKGFFARLFGKNRTQAQEPATTPTEETAADRGNESNP